MTHEGETPSTDLCRVGLRITAFALGSVAAGPHGILIRSMVVEEVVHSELHIRPLSAVVIMAPSLG